jgi:hypothetical protein
MKFSKKMSLVPSRLSWSSFLPVTVAAGLCLLVTNASAQITLEALTRDGYGMVPIKRPQPNVLTVPATINGRLMRLVVDTGWDADGISLDNESASALRLPAAGIAGHGRSATGKEVAFKKGSAAVIELGNVQIKGVPLLLAKIDFLHNQEMRRSVGADGFIGSGFLRTCSAVLDLHNLRLYLRPPGTEHVSPT